MGVRSRRSYYTLVDDSAEVRLAESACNEYGSSHRGKRLHESAACNNATKYRWCFVFLWTRRSSLSHLRSVVTILYSYSRDSPGSWVYMIILHFASSNKRATIIGESGTKSLTLWIQSCSRDRYFMLLVRRRTRSVTHVQAWPRSCEAVYAVRNDRDGSVQR